MNVLQLAIDDIEVQAGFNARRNLGESDGTLDGLAESVRQRGILQPVIVRPAGVEGRYLLVAGHRRLQAAISAGLTHIPASVGSSDQTQLIDAALENLARRGLSLVERGILYRELERSGWTQTRIANMLGILRERVSLALRMLKLPEPVRHLNIDGKLGETHLCELMPLYDAGFSAEYITQIAQRAAAKGSTASAIRIAVNTVLEPGATLGRSVAESAPPRVQAVAPPSRALARAPRTTPAPPRAAGSVLSRQVGALRAALEACASAAAGEDPAEGCREVRRIAAAALEGRNQ